MGDILNAGGTTTSFSNTPQAKDDWYRLNEDAVLAASYYTASTSTLTLDVMANDLGGNAKSLFSIDDAEGNPITDLKTTDLLTNTKYSNWERTDDGNWIRIYNGKVEFKLADPLHPTDAAFARSVNSLGANETIDDKFTYAIKLGNGTLSWATVHINIVGANDAATISGQTSGGVTEDAAINTVSGDLDVSDADSGQAKFETPVAGSLAGAYGNFIFNAETGGWTFTLDNSLSAVQALAAVT